MNPGTIDRPWATWQKAFNTARAGDTVYFRGGVWYLQPGQTVDLINKDGAPGKYIHFFNYPGEKPVLDGSRIIPPNPPSGQYSYSGGPYIDGSNYIHWRGLTIRNFYQVHDRVFVQGIVATNSNFQIFENITVHNIGGRGIYYSPWYAPDTTYFINVDVHHCADSLPLNDVLGGWGDGWNAGVEKGSYMVFDGCRAWSNSDDGFNIWGAGLIVMKNCWSFGNGLLEGDGSGFKLNPTEETTYMGLTRLLTNNVAAFNTGNTGCGFNENNIGSVSMEGRVYNNTSYNNRIGFMTGGFLTGPQKNNDYRNNISCLNTLTEVDENSWSGGNFNTDIKNTWTDGVTFVASKDDFVLTDKSQAIAELTAERKPDGSLPDISFLKLVKGSDLIDKGVDVGLPFSGAAPDIGAFEYGAVVNPGITKVSSIVVTANGGVSSIATDNGTLQLYATVLPANAINKTVKWSISSGTDKASISSTGLLTALKNGTAIAKATANDGSGVYGTLSVTISNQIILVTGISVTGAGGSSLITSIGGTLQLTAAVLPADATNKTVTWSISSGTDKASISPTGLVTALADGTATARASANDGSGIYGTLSITISNQIIQVTGISVTGAGGKSAINTDDGTLQLSAVVTPSNATNKTVIWSISSGTDKAKVSSSGLVSALDNGTATAKATANDGSGVYGTLTITISNQVNPVTGITIRGAGGTSTISTDNGTLQLTADIMPVDATNKTVTWSIFSGNDKARISPTGLVTALDNGTATVRATANDGSGVYGSIIINISNQIVPVTNITITATGGQNSISLNGGSLQLTSTVLPSNATNKTVTWSISSGADKARISSSGLVTALNNGTVIARATANDGSGIYGALMITITNQAKISNTAPVAVVDYQTTNYTGFVGEIDASKSYDSDGDNLTYSWIIPDNIPVSSDSGPVIRYLCPIVDNSRTFEFILNISDGKVTQTKIIPIQVIPYQPHLKAAEISGIEASSFQSPNNPYNIIDGNIGTMWSAEGLDQWIILELKHSFSIHHLKLAFQPGQKKESYFDILGSVDKISWEPILTKSSSCAFSGDIQVFDFPPSKTTREYKYLKLIGLGNSLDNMNYISEMKIFGIRYHSSHKYEELPVKVYPNPASEYVSVRIEDNLMFADFFEIATNSGMVIMKELLDPDVREFSFPLNLKAGHYVLILKSGAIALFTQKLIITH